jgi:hypothetical protein
MLSTTHAAQFEDVLDATVRPWDATVVPHPILRVRLRNVADEVLLLMAL